MQLLLPSDVVRKMRKHMFRAGRREIGGMIMGEQIADQQFRIVEFSVDVTSGTRTNFVRDAEQHNLVLKEFFERTGKDYHRFNYLGEWHTHPSFTVDPSLQDIYAMQDLVDGTGGVDFAVLLISRLRWLWQYDCSASLFLRDHQPVRVNIKRDNPNAKTEGEL